MAYEVFQRKSDGKESLFLNDSKGWKQVSDWFDRVHANELVEDPDFELFIGAKTDGCAVFNAKTGKQITEWLDWIPEPSFRSVELSGYFMARNDDFKWVIFNKEGSKIAEGYDELKAMEFLEGKNSFFLGRKGRHWGLLCKDGLIGDMGEDIYAGDVMYGTGDYFIVGGRKTDGKWAVYDVHTGLPVSESFDEIIFWNEEEYINENSLFVVRNGDTLFVSDMKGNKYSEEIKVGLPHTKEWSAKEWNKVVDDLKQIIMELSINFKISKSDKRKI